MLHVDYLSVGPCALCQQLRGMPVEGWDWFKAMKEDRVTFKAEGEAFDYVRGDYPGGGGAEEMKEMKSGDHSD